MELKTLEIFVETMQLRNFSAVARRRGVNPSSVSREIGRLEKALGTTLFDREIHELVATEAAEGYLAGIQRPLQELEQARQQAQGREGELRGSMTLAAPQAVCIEYLMAHLETWRREYPLVSVELLVREESPVDFSREPIDLAIQNGPAGGIGHSRLLEVHYKLCASPRWDAKSFGDPRQLEELDCLSARDRWRFVSQYADEIKVTPRRSLQCEHEGVLKQAALLGMGPAILPEWMAQESLEKGELVALLPTWRVERIGYDLGLHAVWPGRNLSRKGRVFLAHLTKGGGCKRS